MGKEMTQECATKWRVMTPEQKSEYENLAKANRVRWEGEKAAAEKPKDPLRPKRPPSAYFLFLNDSRANYQNKTDPAKEITKQAGAKWNSLTEAEKTPYQEVAKVKRLEWEEALKVYKIKEQAMVANGGVVEEQDGKEVDGENVQPDGDDADQVPLPNE